MSLLENRWQVYIGIITEPTTKKNQRWFHIFVPELLPIKTGDVTAEDASTTVKLQNVLTNKTEELNYNITSTIYADYFGLVSGFDVPTMYRGMQVLVLNYARGDKWYWVPLERDDSYKTFEHFRISCADEAITNKKKSDAGIKKDDIESRDATLTDDNTYYIEIDTKERKHIKISTASTDGEEFRYFIEIDAEAHSVEIWDNCVDGSQPNNTFKIESRPDPQTLGRITLQNASGNSIIMSGQDTIVNIPRNLVVNIGGDTQFNNSGNVSSKIVKMFTSIVTGNVSTTTDGVTNSVYLGDHAEEYHNNKSVTVKNVHSEQESVRITKTGSSTWANESEWILGTINLTITVDAMAKYVINSLSALIEVFTGSVTGVTNFNTLSVIANIKEAFVANAKSVSGSLINLIRSGGGHHGNH